MEQLLKATAESHAVLQDAMLELAAENTGLKRRLALLEVRVERDEKQHDIEKAKELALRELQLQQLFDASNNTGDFANRLDSLCEEGKASCRYSWHLFEELGRAVLQYHISNCSPCSTRNVHT